MSDLGGYCAYCGTASHGSLTCPERPKLMSECPKCKKLVDAAKKVIDWNFRNGSSMTGLEEAVAEHAKDSPVSVPEFDEEAAEAQALINYPLRGTHNFRKAYFYGARWQFNQIYPQGQSDTPVESPKPDFYKSWCNKLRDFITSQGYYPSRTSDSWIFNQFLADMEDFHTECIHDWKARKDEGSICQRCGAALNFIHLQSWR